MITLEKIWAYVRLRKGGLSHKDAVFYIQKVCLPSWWTDKNVKHFIW